MQQSRIGRGWLDAAAIAGLILFLAICVVFAGALTARPAPVGEDPQPTPPFPTVSAPATPAGPRVEDCIRADQFVRNGLLTGAEQYYAAAAPSPGVSASPAASATATAVPSPGDGLSCAVAGLQYVAEQKQHAAVLAAQGDAARSDGNEERAKDLYQKALAADRGNVAAAEGLRTLGAQPASRLQQVQDRLQHTRTTILDPLGSLLLWVLAIAVGLYLLILLTKAAARVPWPLFRQQRWRQALHIVAIVVTALGGIALAVGAGLAWVHEAGWPWLVGLGVAALLALISWSWYLRLRKDLRLDVNKVGGQADPQKAAFLLGQLVAMGSEQPRSIRTVRQPDVTSLSATALSVLPGGNFLSTALQVLSATSTASPWQATVSMIDANQVAVHLERYGTSVTDIVADRRDLWFHDADPASICDIGDDGLLTIAAAVILAAMADAHDELERGLAGARKWQSIAGQVLAGQIQTGHVASAPPKAGQVLAGDVASASRKAQLALLARAVDTEPGNFAARVDYLYLAKGSSTSAAGQRQFAESMDGLESDMREHLEQEPVYQRVLFNRAVGWLNTYLLQRAAGQPVRITWGNAQRRSRELREFLDHQPKDEKRADFWREMRERAEWVWRGVQATDPALGQGDQVADTPAAGAFVGEKRAVGNAPTARQYYDCACTRAARRDYPAALKALELAVGDPELNVYAQTDASFAELLDPERVQDPGHAGHLGPGHLPTADDVAGFYKIIGQPGAQRFTALDPFAKYGDALWAAGVHTEHDLLRLTNEAGQRRLFAQQLGVSELVVQRWRGIGELAASDPIPERDREQRLAYLEMLLARDVDSLAELRRKVGALHQELLDHPLWRTTPPPTSQTLACWAARGVSRAVCRLRAAAHG